jgi:hypothetical protein
MRSNPAVAVQSDVTHPRDGSLILSDVCSPSCARRAGGNGATMWSGSWRSAKLTIFCKRSPTAHGALDQHEISRSGGQTAAARRGAERWPRRFLHALGGLARALSRQTAVHRGSGGQRRTRPEIPADGRFARRAGRASGAAQGDGPVSRLHGHQPGQTLVAFQMAGSQRASGFLL